MLFSAGSFFRKTERFRNLTVPSWASKILVDSGAQQFFTKFKTDYPYDTREYLEKFAIPIGELAPSGHLSVASLDLPLDILVKRGVGAKAAIERTASNTQSFLDLFEELDAPGQPLPVIQGLTVADFRYCLDLYRERGLLDRSEWWGIGSVCMASARHVIRVCRYIRAALPGKKLHAFGPRTAAWPAIWGLLDSIDTGLFGYGTRYGFAYIFAEGSLYNVERHHAARKIPSHVLMSVSLRALDDYAHFLSANCPPKLESFLEASA